MPGLLQLTKPESVEAAISEYVELGRDEFLRKYGYQRARLCAMLREITHKPSTAMLIIRIVKLPTPPL